MEFRWVALVALWTLVCGPILGVPTGPASAGRQAQKKAVKPLVKHAARR
jgi:hypothetical protein